MHYWDKGSLAGGDTPIGAVKHSFIVQQLYCQTTTRDPDLSFGSLVFENFILDIRRGVKNEYFTVRLTVRGGGSAQSAVTINKCEDVDPLFH